MKTLKLHSWSAVVASALLVIGGLGSTELMAQSEQVEDEEAAELDRVVITGSRIARTAIEGPSPVTVIDREQLDREGFTSVADALKSLNQVSGLGQPEADVNQFTVNANYVNLRNLGPGRVLVLVDGRRLADYPLPYNSQSNIVNLSAIPLTAVDRIEFLASGASAIYGSDAIAGVINIILRKDLANSLDLNVRYGDYVDGGGENVRVQGVGGFLGDKWNITYAFEYNDLDPVYARQRDFLDSTNDAPLAAERINSRMAVEIDIFGSQVGTPIYVDPRDAQANPCADFPNLELSSRPDPNTGERFYCGTDTWVGEQSILNGREQVNFYTAGTYEIGNHELFASANYFQLDAEVESFFSYYFNQTPYYVPNSNAQSLPLFGVPGGYVQAQRIFSIEEIGGPEAKRWAFDEEVVDYQVGIRGQLFSPYWDYELSFASVNYDLEEEQRLLVDELVVDYFWDFVGGGDPFGFGFPVYNIDYDALYSPLTPEIWNQLTDISPKSAESSNDTIQAVITGDLFDLPAGTASLAAVFEWGSQDYDIQLDQRLVDGYFWGLTDTGGGGERDRYAVGTELILPLHETLQVSLAGRWDKYDDITNVDDAFTYNLGVEYRPSDRVLLRGSYATSFRAPDMHFVFADVSGFFAFVDDNYLCERDESGVPLGACTNADVSVFGQRQGNTELQEEEGDSITVGFVIEPINNLSISADYWEIELENIIIDDPLQRTLELEADCRLGRRDPTSGLCELVFSRITRNPVIPNSTLSETLIQVDTTPVNAAFNKVNGIDASLNYTLETTKAGIFTLNLGYTHVLGDDFQQVESDPVENVRDQASNWRSRVRGTLNWQYRDFTATLFGERFGSTRSYEGLTLEEFAEEPRMGPQMYYNLSLGYEFLDGKADVTLIVQNLFDEKPPVDQSWSGWPYYSFSNYYYPFTLGQSWALQAGYRFDY